VVTSKTVISVTAYGAGKSATYNGTVDILPNIILTTRDSLAAHGWRLVKREDWKISTNTVVAYWELSTIQLSDVKFYTLDGYVKQFHAGEATAFASFWYTLVGKTLTSGDQVYTITLLTNSKLQYEQIDRYTADTVIKSFYEAVP